MPRKTSITKKVRRLTPREVSLLVRGVVAFQMEVETDPNFVQDHFVKELDALQGMYKHLAIIVEEEK